VLQSLILCLSIQAQRRSKKSIAATLSVLFIPVSTGTSIDERLPIFCFLNLGLFLLFTLVFGSQSGALSSRSRCVVIVVPNLVIALVCESGKLSTGRVKLLPIGVFVVQLLGKLRNRDTGSRSIDLST
jgi:hypothetical protein